MLIIKRKGSNGWTDLIAKDKQEAYKLLTEKLNKEGLDPKDFEVKHRFFNPQEETRKEAHLLAIEYWDKLN